MSLVDPEAAPHHPPTPAAWLNDLLKRRGLSRTAAAKLVSYDRVRVTRWANARETVPREVLRQYAIALAPDEEQYALLLHDLAVARRLLHDRATEFGRRQSIDPLELVEAILCSVGTGRGVGFKERQINEQISIATVGRIMLECAGRNLVEGEELISPETLYYHLRYPANRALAALLSGGGSTQWKTVRELLLLDLRKCLRMEPASRGHELVRHHALHMLGRCGEPEDRDLVEYELESGLAREDPLARKLAFCGLMMVPGVGLERAEKFTNLLVRDQYLGIADLAFDATHYGDLVLAGDGGLRHPDKPLRRLAENISKHFLLPDDYGQIANADALRLLRIIDQSGLRALTDTSQSMLLTALESDLFPSSQAGAMLRSRVADLWSPNWMQLVSPEVAGYLEESGFSRGHLAPSHTGLDQSVPQQLYIVYPGGTVKNENSFNNKAEQIEIGVQGSHARVEKVEQKQALEIDPDLDAEGLAEELLRLMLHLQSTAGAAGDFRAVADVAEAIEAVESRDTAKLREKLQAAGKRALSAAIDIGSTVAADAIRKSMGG